MNRKIRPKCGLAGLEIKPLLQFHVISVLFPNHQLGQCQRSVRAQRAWQSFSVISASGFWESHYCQRAAARERKGSKVSTSKTCTCISRSVLTGDTGVGSPLPNEVDLFYWVPAAISVLHITWTLHCYLYLNILTNNRANWAESSVSNNTKLQFVHR